MQFLLKLFRILFWLTFSGVIIGIAGAFGVYYYFGQDLPKNLTEVHHYSPLRTTEIYSAGGELIGEFYLERRVIVPLESIPDHMIQAIIAAEDQRFFLHPGIDPIGTVRAFIANVSGNGIRQGASGLTQQLARGFFLTTERTYTRKIKEAILSFRIERELSKEQILALYLNYVYLGHGAYGVQAAAELYFGKDARELTLGEAAVLAGLPQAPTRYSPYVSYESARVRQAYVLGRMVALNFISTKQADDAISAPLVIVAKPDPNLRHAPYFVSEIRRKLIERFGWERIYGGGLKVYTTVDLRLQEAAQNALKTGLKEVERRRGWSGPELSVGDLGVEQEKEAFKASLAREKQGVTVSGRYRGVVTWVDKKNVYIALGDLSLLLDPDELFWAMRNKVDEEGNRIGRISRVSDVFSRGDILPVIVKNLPASGGPGIVALDYEPIIEGALVTIDPATSEVKALVGGYDYERSEFNRATQGRRQVGSAFKPFVYAAALDHGYTPDTIVVDSPISFSFGGQSWSPKNYGGKYYGSLPLRRALAKSLNTVAVKLGFELGVQRVTEYARRFGIKSPLPEDFTIALGSADLSVLEMTAAYAAFPAMGRRVDPIFIRKIEDDKGRMVWESPPKPPLQKKDPFQTTKDDPNRALSSATAYLMVDMMKGVVQAGTATRAKVLGRPAAGKTGTTNENRNVWFMGYTPDYVCGVWVGYDDNHSIGSRETGGKAALPIWVALMQIAHEGKPIRDFEVPQGIVFRKEGNTYTPIRRKEFSFSKSIQATNASSF